MSEQSSENSHSVDSYNSRDRPHMKQKRLRRRHLNEHQQTVLENEYQINPRFDCERIQALSKLLGLNKTKIYKWGWDRRKKELGGRPGPQSMFQTQRIVTSDQKKSN